ncbi:MAG: heavy metal-associated domain-containing protein [Rickettsiales bacterium]|nr:heavy metal-associated domain-containing protein [Rickettsiales bacterium]
MKYLIALFLLASTPVQAAPQCIINAQVNGLVCDFCARALEKVFSTQETVDSINVDLDKGIVAVTMKAGQSALDDATLTKLITDSGYNLTAINKEC